jgi:3-phenylpropionate/trans-cinnamate dioxygenase ferredoxin reductase component
MSGVVIVGAGLAGARCAETLRALGYTGRVRLVGDEPAPPYERPALSKELLASEREPEDLGLREAPWWTDAGIELVLGNRIEAIAPRTKTATLASGKDLHWDALVLATGARARSIRTFDVPGTYRLRSLADALSLREELQPGRRLAIIGAGFVGTEVASTAARLGVDITLIDPLPPLRRVLGSEVSSLLARHYRAHGVRVLQSGVARVAKRGRRIVLVLEDGSPLFSDAVLVAVGAEPAGELLGGQAAGIDTDAAGCTEIDGIYACGDVAAAWHPLLGRRIRVEHWTDAATQGATVAHAILGEEPPPRPLPYFWSDQFGLRLQYLGHASKWCRVDLEGGSTDLRARYLDREGRPLAALLVNRPRELSALRHELAEAA